MARTNKENRQVRYMRNNRDKGLCFFCPEEAVSGGMCEAHNIARAVARFRRTRPVHPRKGRWLSLAVERGLIPRF